VKPAAPVERVASKEHAEQPGYTIEIVRDKGYAVVTSTADPTYSTTVRIGPSTVEPVMQHG